MGVPKFFRWISERYPKINQRVSFPPNIDTYNEHFNNDEENDNDNNTNNNNNKKQKQKRQPPKPLEEPDPMSLCYGKSSVPPIDRLYIDMNGIIHGCSHNNNNAQQQQKSQQQDNSSNKISDSKSSIGTGSYNPNQETLPSSSSSSNTTTSSIMGIEEADINNDSIVDQNIRISKKEIFNNICYYLDRIVKDITKPNELVYMAIDGVAPRAKLNQQRSRRYRSGTAEGEIERTIYTAHQQAIAAEKKKRKEQEGEKDFGDADYDYGTEKDDYIIMTGSNNYNKQKGNVNKIEETEPGRFTGKFESHDIISQNQQQEQQKEEKEDDNSSKKEQKEQLFSSNDNDDNDDDDEYIFHSNSITPGTPFFDECVDHIIQFIKYKLTNDDKWKHLTIIFSGPNVPGEGEHKIMNFIRQQQSLPTYNNNMGHCIVGQDGDLIMLGLATHEPNMILLREQVIFDMKRKELLEEYYNSQQQTQQQQQQQSDSVSSSSSSSSSSTSSSAAAAVSSALDRYIHNCNFEFLHMNILRDYISYDFETSNVVGGEGEGGEGGGKKR